MSYHAWLRCWYTSPGCGQTLSVSIMNKTETAAQKNEESLLLNWAEFTEAQIPWLIECMEIKHVLHDICLHMLNRYLCHTAYFYAAVEECLQFKLLNYHVRHCKTIHWAKLAGFTEPLLRDIFKSVPVSLPYLPQLDRSCVIYPQSCWLSGNNQTVENKALK